MRTARRPASIAVRVPRPTRRRRLHRSNCPASVGLPIRRGRAGRPRPRPSRGCEARASIVVAGRRRRSGLRAFPVVGALRLAFLVLRVVVVKSSLRQAVDFCTSPAVAPCSSRFAVVRGLISSTQHLQAGLRRATTCAATTRNTRGLAACNTLVRELLVVITSSGPRAR